MTCPAPHRFDAYLDGDLDGPAADGVRQHLESCPACAAEAALARRIDAALGDARGVRAPETLVQAALAQARRAPRPAPARGPLRGDRRPSRRLTLAASALALAVVVATTWATLEAPSGPPDAPLVAQQTSPPSDAAPDEPLVPAASAPADVPPSPTTVSEAEDAPAPAAAPPAPDPPEEPAADPSASSPVGDAPIAATVPENIPTPAEVQQATADLRLAFALVADAQQQAGRALREEAGPVASTLDSALPF